MQTVISGLLILSSVFLIGLSYYALNKKNLPGARSFSLLCIASAIYTFGYGMEIRFFDIDSIDFWSKFQYLGLPFIPALWIDLAFKFSRYNIRKKLKYNILLLSIPILTLIFRFTSGTLHLHYSEINTVFNGHFTVLQISRGPWYYIHYLYFIASSFIAIFIYYNLNKRSRGYIKTQSKIMILASIVPVFSLLFNILGITPLMLDAGPFFLVFDYIIFAIGIFKYNFLHIIPLARAKTFSSISEGVMVLDLENNIIDYNYSLLNIFKELNEIDKKQELSIDDVKNQDFVNKFISKTNKEFEFDDRESKEIKHYIAKISELYDGKLLVGNTVIINDITKLVRAIKTLEISAKTDGLTGLYNRRYLIETIEKNNFTETKNGNVSLIIFDIDHFKNVNDTYGHQAGDYILKSIANLIAKYLNLGLIFGRYGGEEFIIYSPTHDKEEMTDIAEKLRLLIENHDFAWKDKTLKITASFGVTTFSFSENNGSFCFDELLSNADTALYLAKTKGRNRVEVV